MFAGVSSSSRATCFNTEVCRQDRRWDTKVRLALVESSQSPYVSWCLMQVSAAYSNTDKCLIYTELGVECQAFVAPYPF